ncbi:MAG: DNA repair protein RadC [Bacteroidetes bacterium]|nr:MAG: DNA repair protein RadC [Bacteroidota bacterium]
MKESNENKPKPTNTGIKSWAPDDRPREKLLSKGPMALSDGELLAILIGSGTRELSAVDLARNILASVQNSITELSRMGIKDLIGFKGIGEAKAINIAAALELGRRRRLKDSLEKKKITSSRDAFEIMHPLLSDNNYEEFWIITLNRGNLVKRTIRISEGSLAGTVADPKKIFKLALEDNASSIILCHNHPSGNISPSKKDTEITQKCKNAGLFLDMPVLDHIIIGGDSYFSFADEGLL